MYTDEIRALSPYFHDFSHEVQQLLLDELFHSPSMIESSLVHEHVLGGEGDLFKEPKPIIEEPIVSLDPREVISTITFGKQEDVMPETQELEARNFELLQIDELNRSYVSYECKNDVLVSSFTEAQIVGLPAIVTEENQLMNDESAAFQKSVSTGSLIPSSGNTMKASVLDLSELDLVGAAYGMRRAFSEGDIKALGKFNQWHRVTGYSSEDRQQKLTRYKIKKLKRNFGKKVKYACRKALADSQPRVRGRFARTRTSASR